MSEGKRSRCVKYERRLVWYAPDVIAKATSTAFCRTCTNYYVSTIECIHIRCIWEKGRTRPAVSDCKIQCCDEVCEEDIHFVQSSKNIDYIRTRVVIFLAQYSGKERSQRLHVSAAITLESSDKRLYIERVSVPGTNSRFDMFYWSRKEVSCLRLQKVSVLFITFFANLCPTCKCRRSSALSSLIVLSRDALSGFNRKNSRQNPSDFSSSSSSWRLFVTHGNNNIEQQESTLKRLS